MSNDAKKRLEIVGLVVAIIAACWGVIASSVLMPYRMDAAESDIRQVSSDIREVKAEYKEDHEMVTRIDERTARMEKMLDRLAK